MLRDQINIKKIDLTEQEATMEEAALSQEDIMKTSMLMTIEKALTKIEAIIKEGSEEVDLNMDKDIHVLVVQIIVAHYKKDLMMMKESCIL
jgi:hypothetical protein